MSNRRSAQTLQYRFPEPIIEIVVPDSARTIPWIETARTWPPKKDDEAENTDEYDEYELFAS